MKLAPGIARGPSSDFVVVGPAGLLGPVHTTIFEQIQLVRRPIAIFVAIVAKLPNGPYKLHFGRPIVRVRVAQVIEGEGLNGALIIQ